MIKKYYIKLLLAPVLWGGALVAGRIIAVKLPPFTTTFLRYSIVSILLLPILYRKEGEFPVPTIKTGLLLLIVSISGVLMFNYFLFSGLRTVTAIRSSIFIAITPALIAFLSIAFFHEKLTLSMLFGIFLAFSGAVITLSNGDLTILLNDSLSRGDLYLLGCTFSWAVYSISAKYTMQSLSPLAVLSYSSVLGTLLLLPFIFQEGVMSRLGTQSLDTWFSLLYLSIGAAGIAHLWYYEGIKAVGVSKSAIFLNLEPVAAITLGIIILGEKLTYTLFIGAVLVISGLVLTNYRKNKSYNLK